MGSKDESAARERIYSKGNIKFKNENAKLKDLEVLKSQESAVPFSSAENVTEYMLHTKDVHGRMNKHLYLEVQYARRRCLTLEDSVTVFRLKRDGKNLSNDEYADNLREYFSDAKAKSNIIMADLHNVLYALGSESESSCPTNSSLNDMSDYKVRKHVASFWVEIMERNNGT